MAPDGCLIDVLSLQELLLRAFIHVCNPPQPHALPPEIFTVTFQAVSEEVEALYRPRALTAAAVFEFNGGLQFWRVPVSGVYRITARGAKAADGAFRWRSIQFIKQHRAVL